MEVSLLHPKAPHVRKPLFLVTASAVSSSRPGVRKSNLLLTDASPGCKEHMSMIRTSIQVCLRYSYYRHYHAAASKKVLFSIQNTSVSIQHETKESVESTSKGHPVSGDGIRRRFLEFYASRGHKVLPSASLVPDDPTVLLTIAGMLQFKPIFLGKAPRKVTRATTSQRCIRTNDVDNVGRTTRHQTFFEMLGNFSFGDYFKREAINWAWDLTTKDSCVMCIAHIVTYYFHRFGLPPERLWISVFEDDDESFSIWRDEVGVPVQQIKRMGEDDNFWTSGATGPCGPCSEIYYDFHPEWGHSDVVCII